MKYEIDIPDGKFCDNCPFCQEVVINWGMEESYDWCSILRKSINDEHPYGKIKRLKECPNKKS